MPPEPLVLTRPHEPNSANDARQHLRSVLGPATLPSNRLTPTPTSQVLGLKLGIKQSLVRGVAKLAAFTEKEVEHLLNFVGYGSADASVWFLGMEEAGGGEDNLRARLTFNSIEDLREAHLKLGLRQFHDFKRPRIQRTWRGMSYVMLRLNQEEPSRETIRKYQSTQLGR